MTQKPKNLPAIILDMPNEEYHRKRLIIYVELEAWKSALRLR